MNSCEVCGTELKPLFTGVYCPNENLHERVANLKAYLEAKQAEVNRALDQVANPRFWIPIPTQGD